MSLEEKIATPAVDYLRPIIADGDTGFGGITSVMKLIKMHIEAGAAGVHIEDQKPGAKKCGHMGGKVLVSMREHCDRMAAARLQADIMGVETVLIARTDACSATFLETTIDGRDHPYILGSTNPTAGSLEDYIATSSLDRASAETKWKEEAKLMRYTDCILAALDRAGASDTLKAEWKAKSMQMSHPQAQQLAASMNVGGTFFDWDAPRTREGYYRVQGGTDYSTARAIAFSDCSDCIWMETDTPNVAQADEFSKAVHAVVPHQMLSYNLSPSFNWDAAGMNDAAIQQFQTELGNRGFVWHFITLCGFHTQALAVDAISKAYASEKGVLAYVQMIQREEKRLGVETLTHQKWSGAEMQDFAMGVATGGGASTASLKGATEAQFTSKL